MVVYGQPVKFCFHKIKCMADKVGLTDKEVKGTRDDGVWVGDHSCGGGGGGELGAGQQLLLTVYSHFLQG